MSSDQPLPSTEEIQKKLSEFMKQEFGDRVVWGTDWPHPNHTHRPDDGMLVDILAEIAPDEAARQALLVDNPQRLYRFAPARKLVS